MSVILKIEIKIKDLPKLSLFLESLESEQPLSSISKTITPTGLQRSAAQTIEKKKGKKESLKEDPKTPKKGRKAPVDNNEILKYLEEHGESKTTDIARHFKVPDSNMWNYLKVLFDEGLLSSRKIKGARAWRLKEIKPKPKPETKQKETDLKESAIPSKAIGAIEVPLEDTLDPNAPKRRFKIVEKEAVKQNG